MPQRQKWGPSAYSRVRNGIRKGSIHNSSFEEDNGLPAGWGMGVCVHVPSTLPFCSDGNGCNGH